MPVESWFPTPIYNSIIDNVDEVQAELYSAYNDIKKQDKFQRPPFFETSNFTVSDPTFTADIIKKYNLYKFKKEIYSNVDKYIDNVFGPNFPYKYKIRASWFTNTEKGQYSKRHSHGRADLSGVYYLQTTGSDGDICFSNPCPTHGTTIFFDWSRVYPTVNYNPAVGRIILWPGWMEHATQENTTDSTRVSFSFNINFNTF
jgi:uncharacterized protein (TIGR02466 family)